MKLLSLSVVMILLASCATEVPRQPTTLIPSAEGEGQGRIIQVDEDAEVWLPSGYTRSIRAGSTWKQSGTVEGRAVYKPTKDVFTIEGTHVHEAYLLLDENTLVGFFLPGENAVSWLKKKVILKFH